MVVRGRGAKGSIFLTNSVFALALGTLVFLLALPEHWLPGVVVGLILAFVGSDLLISSRQRFSLLRREFMVWTLYSVVFLLLALTGGVGSPYFFLLYAVVIAGTMVLRLAQEIILLIAIVLIALIPQGLGGWTLILTAADPLSLLIQIGSLLAFGPLVSYLAWRQSQLEEVETQLDTTLRALDLSEHELADVMARVTDGLIVLDKCGRIERLSDGGERLLQKRASQVVEKEFLATVDQLQIGKQKYFHQDWDALKKRFADSKAPVVCTVVIGSRKASWLLSVFPLEQGKWLLILEDARLRETFERRYPEPQDD